MVFKTNYDIFYVFINKPESFRLFRKDFQLGIEQGNTLKRVNYYHFLPFIC